MPATIEYRAISALEKIFCDEPLQAPAMAEATALQGEVFSFQVALRCVDPVPDQPERFGPAAVAVTAESPWLTTVREVVSVPVDVPCIRGGDGLLRDTPGLYPDALVAHPQGVVRLDGCWRACWITVRVPGDAEPGPHSIIVRITDIGFDRSQQWGVGEVRFTLTVFDVALPPQRLLRYEWIHADCLAQVARAPVWSEEHWRVLEAHVVNAAAHGVNVLLTPLWTPPLDTAPGHDRLTTQLLEIAWENGRYHFNFERLARYIAMGQRAGMTHFGMSHAFTQWGAQATPQIVVRVAGRAEKRFGWHVASDDPTYEAFLTELMAVLLPWLEAQGLAERVFFSVSDEPNLKVLASYHTASTMFHRVIDGWPTLEALSDIDFHRLGLIKRPVPASDHIEDFVGQVEEPWVYYCGWQEIAVSNRFLAMPLARVRIMGVLCYLYRIAGFLHWGYNFYNNQFSFEPVDPWRENSGGRWVPAGDPFLVYPGQAGEPVDSIRNEVFFDAVQDLGALQALEEHIGREAVEALIHEGLQERLRMDRYPIDALWLLVLRQRINEHLAKARMCHHTPARFGCPAW